MLENRKIPPSKNFFRKFLLQVIIFISIFFFFIHPVNGDGDIFHHLQAGRYIIEHKQLPQLDEYTFTARGKPWIANAWGTDIIYYILYNSFGPTGISIFVAFQAVIVFILLYLLLRIYDIPQRTTLLSLAFAAAVLSTRWPNRPELVTYPFVILILLIDRLRSRFSKIIFAYIPMFFLWPILYGGSTFVGFLLLGIICIKQFFTDKYNITQKALLLYIATFASFIVSFLNGYGYKTIFYIFFIPNITKAQGEWRGIFDNLFNNTPVQILINQYRIAIFLLFFITFLFLVLFQNKQMRNNSFLSLLSLSLIAPFFAMRNIPLATILALPLFAVLLDKLLKTTTSKIYSFCIVSLCIVLLTIAGWSNSHGIGDDKKSFPSRLIQFLKNNDISGNTFTNQQTGSFISYNLYPRMLVYADTRDDLYGGTLVLNDLVAVQRGNKSLINLLDKYHATIVVADITEGKIYQQLLYSTKWTLIYVNDRYLVFIEESTAKKKHLRQFTAIDPFADNGAKHGKEREAIAEYNFILSQNPYSFNIQFLLSQVLLSQKNYQDVILVANRMQIPHGVGEFLFRDKKDFILATAHLQLNNCMAAKQDIDNYHNDLHHKFIFYPFKKLTGVDEELYMLYYLTCERNEEKAQTHLINFINDSDIPNNLKQSAEGMYQQLLNAGVNIFRQ